MKYVMNDIFDAETNCLTKHALEFYTDEAQNLLLLEFDVQDNSNEISTKRIFNEVSRILNKIDTQKEHSIRLDKFTFLVLSQNMESIDNIATEFKKSVILQNEGVRLRYSKNEYNPFDSFNKRLEECFQNLEYQ